MHRDISLAMLIVAQAVLVQKSNLLTIGWITQGVIAACSDLVNDQDHLAAQLTRMSAQLHA